MNELIEFIIDENGEPKTFEPFNAHELGTLPATLPNQLIEFYQAYGRCILQGGRLQTCHPNDLKGVFSLAFGDDEDFNQFNCHPFAYTAFGTIYFYQDSFGCGDVDLLEGRLCNTNFTSPKDPNSNFDNTIDLPFALDHEDLDFFDINDKPLFSRAKKKLGSLEIGECYGFVPALSIAGVAELKYLKRLRATEHFTIISQTCQIQFIDVLNHEKPAVIRRIINNASKDLNPDDLFHADPKGADGL